MNGTTTTPATRTVALRLDPLDVLFFRDGRPFTPASRGQSGLPWPQTLAGALRSHLLRSAGCDSSGFRRLAQQLRAGQTLEQAIATVCGADWIARVELRGPWLCQEVDGRLEVLVPVPATLYQLEQVSGNHSREKHDLPAAKAGRNGSAGDADPPWVRLAPLAPELDLPGWRPPAPGMRPLWVRERARSERVAGYLRPAGLAAFLKGKRPPADSLVKREELFDFDHRTGIVIRPDELTNQKGLIYAVSFLALREGVCFYAEVVLPDGAFEDALCQEAVLDFGGEGRKVRMQPVPRFSWPEAPAPENGRVLLLLTSPAVFAQRWRPRLPADTRLIAAAVNGYEAFSGWDLARGGPKPTRFAVRAGSVYFLESSSGQFPSCSLAESDEDRRLGYGCVVQGVWNYG